MANSTHKTRFVLSAEDKTKNALRSVKSNLLGVGKAATGVHSQILGLAGIGGFGFLVSGVIETNKQFQKLKSSLKTVTGSTKAAAQAFDLIEDFATTTPFELDQVVESFIKLKALGLDPSERALRSYGNTASAMGKSMNQMIEAVADASTGEFERLKEFGITSSKAGDEVTLTFQGVETTIKNTSANIQGYLLDLGESKFGGAMADQMKVMEAAFSNFSGAIKGVQVAIGEAGLNDTISELVNKSTEWINSLDQQQIEQFTKAALLGFADVLDAADKGLSYIDDNPYLTEAGIVGYMLFGKRGIAAVLAGQALIEGVASATSNIGMGLVGPGITPGNGNSPEGIALTELQTQLASATGPMVGILESQVSAQQAIVDALVKTESQINQLSFAENYKLGDFSASQPATSFEEFREKIRGSDEKKIDQVETTNSILKEIADTIRNQSNAAVAG